MSEAFLKVINMSISAGWLVLAVLALRLILKKTPRWIHVLLWGIVAVRLISPFSIESNLSVIPDWKVETQDIISISEGEHKGQILDSEGNILVEKDLFGASEGYGQIIGSDRNMILEKPLKPLSDSAEATMPDTIRIIPILWLLGMTLMLGYAFFSYLRLKQTVATSVVMQKGIRQSEYIDSPFVLGIFCPVVYLPYGMVESDIIHVVAHEQAHIQRKDHWWKPLGFLLLTIHWFNPLMCVAYILLCRDIELACDEKVIKELGSDQRADYTRALVACSVNRRMIAACPLAFGEVGVKKRVKSIMNYRKPAFWIIVTAVVICVIVAVCFLTDPPQGQTEGIDVNAADRVVMIRRHEGGSASIEKLLLDPEAVSELIDMHDSLVLKDYSSPLSDERFVLRFYSGEQQLLEWHISWYEEDDTVVTSCDTFGTGNRMVTSDFRYKRLLEIFAGASEVTMFPTDTTLHGLQAGALLVPIDGKMYRYALAVHDPEGVTVDELLDSFQEIPLNAGIGWNEGQGHEVFSLKEYPDRSVVLLISATGSWLCTYDPPRRCSDTALADAIDAGYVVMEGGYAAHNQEVWQEFIEQTRQGRAAEVTIADYWKMIFPSSSYGYLQVFGQDYPCLYTYHLSFDGTNYTLSFQSGGELHTRTYEHLMRYDSEAIRYVLTHDNTVTWEQIFYGMVSSQAGVSIDHYSIYTERKP